MTDEARLPVDFRIATGQATGDVQAISLLEGREVEAVIADRGYDSAEIVANAESLGAVAVIPPRRRWKLPAPTAKSSISNPIASSDAFNRRKHFRRFRTRDRRILETPREGFGYILKGVMRPSFQFKLLFILSIIGGLLVPITRAESVSGIITNRTSNKPSAGDDVVLIRLTQGMQESTRTKSDSRGRYTLEVPEQGFHLVRVTHDKVNYFKPFQADAKSVDVDVYTASAKVEGVVGEADVMRLQTGEDGKTLHVVESFFVKNDSSPPMTQFSERSFEFYLPKGARVEGSGALAPGSMPVQASPIPLGDPDHYAFIFPLRPGETRFQVSYTLPYSDRLQLAQRPVQATDTVAIVMPKAMKFQAASSGIYNSIQDGVDAQTFVARNVEPAQSLWFTVSGTGQLPRDSEPATSGNQQSNQTPEGNGNAANDVRPGGGLGNPIDPNGTNDPWAKYRWWIIGAISLAMVAGAGLMLRRPTAGSRASVVEATISSSTPPSALMVLKEEFFLLETDRLQGLLVEKDYVECKAALEVILKRVLSREVKVSY